MVQPAIKKPITRVKKPSIKASAHKRPHHAVSSGALIHSGSKAANNMIAAQAQMRPRPGKLVMHR